MNRQAKLDFIDDLVGSVAGLIRDRVDSLPDHWDGIELREYIADKFAEQTFLGRRSAGRDRAAARRKRDYRNDVIVRNL